MIYQITSDNLELSESMKELAETKISKLEKFFPNTDDDLVTARIVMNKSAEEDAFKAKLELEVAGKLYFGEERDYSLESALVEAIGEVERQIEKSRSENEKEWEKRREMKKAPINETEEL